MKSGNLNFLELSGPLQAYNGIDFLFFLIIDARSGKHQRPQSHLHEGTQHSDIQRDIFFYTISCVTSGFHLQDVHTYKISYIESVWTFAQKSNCTLLRSIDLHCSRNIVRVIKSRRMRWAGHVAGMGEMRGVYRLLVGKPEGKRPLGRPRRRWEDNIKTDLQELDGVVWTGSSWFRIRTGGGHLWMR